MEHWDKVLTQQRVCRKAVKANLVCSVCKWANFLASSHKLSAFVEVLPLNLVFS